MTFKLTDRLGLPQWSDRDRDSPTMAEFSAAFLAIEQLAAIAEQGSLSARPQPGVSGRFYLAADTGCIYYDNGQVWLLVGSRLNAPNRNTAAQIIRGAQGQAVSLTSWETFDAQVVAQMSGQGQLDARTVNVGAGGLTVGGATALSGGLAVGGPLSAYGGMSSSQGATFGGYVTSPNLVRGLTQVQKDGSGNTYISVPGGLDQQQVAYVLSTQDVYGNSVGVPHTRWAQGAVFLADATHQAYDAVGNALTLGQTIAWRKFGVSSAPV